MAIFIDGKDTLVKVKSFQKRNSFQLSGDGHHLDGRIFDVLHSKDRFEFKTSSTINAGIQLHDELRFEKNVVYQLLNDKMIFVKGQDIFVTNVEYGEDKKLLRGEIHAFSDISFDLKELLLFRRLLMPVDPLKFSINDFVGTAITFAPNTTAMGIPVSINGNHLCLYKVKMGAEEYICIDSLERLEMKEFRKFCFSMLLSYGVIKGDFFNDQSFIMSFAEPEMKSSCEVDFFHLGSSILTGQPTFTTNMFSLYRDKIVYDESGELNEAFRKEIHNDVYFFPNEVFGKLAEGIYNHEKVQRAALLYLYGHNASLEMRLPNYYVAIEAMTSYIYKFKGVNGRLNPIVDPDLAAEIQQEFIENLTRLKAKKSLSDSDFNLEILSKNILKLNAPANADKLSGSFALLGFTLTPEDKKILKERNTFLHGSFIKYLDDQDALQKALHIALRARFLVAVLMLKLYGYSGYIINYASLWQTMTNKDFDEPRNVKI